MRPLALFIPTIAIALASCGKPDTATPINPTTEAQTAAASVKTAELVTASEAVQKTLKPRRDAFLQHLRANEPKIKDVAWLNETGNSLLVGVIPDKSKRHDGYAEYVCRIATEHKIYGGIVRIMDVTAAAQDNWHEIGRADCATEDQATTPPQFVDFEKTSSQK